MEKKSVQENTNNTTNNIWVDKSLKTPSDNKLLSAMETTGKFVTL